MVLEGSDTDESESKIIWEHDAPCNFPLKYLKVFYAFHKIQSAILFELPWARLSKELRRGSVDQRAV